MTKIFYAAHDGHVFVVNFLGNGYACVTNENGCQTRALWRELCRILGGDFTK